jgi:protein-S-isoprenylcysteine O-methyltransferase Ste14
VTNETGRPPDLTGIRIIPPLVFLASIAAAFLLDWLWPARVGLPDVLRWVLGAALIVAPFLVLPSIMAAFRRAGSEYDVRRVPRRLVTGGAFRYSRNPGYVLMAGFCAGVGLAANNPWVFLAVVPAILVVHYSVVLKEEAVLEKEFGEDYLQYKRRVRRWI